MVCEPENKILASSIRRRWPPDRVCSGWCSTRSGRPRLAVIEAACDSAAYPPSTASRSSSLPYLRMAAAAAPESGAAICASAARRSARSWSSPRADSTRSMASVSRSPVRGSCGRYPTEPDRRTEPAAGWPCPASTLASVVLPAPFRPTRPIRSPVATWNDALSSSRRAPARSSMSLATIMIRCSCRTDVNGQTLGGFRGVVPPGQHSPREGVFSPSCAARRPVYVTGSRRANGFRLGQADADGQEGTRNLLQYGEPRIGNGEEAVGGEAQVWHQPQVAAQDRDGPLVAAQDERV